MDVKSSFYNIKYIFSIRTLGNFGFIVLNWIFPLLIMDPD